MRCGSYARPLWDTYRAGQDLRLHTINARIQLAADGANHGKNETGISRYRSIVRAAAKAGLAIEWTTGCSNSYATQSDFEGAL